MCNNKLTATKFEELDKFIDGLDENSKKGSLIAILHKAQSLFGYLPKEVQLHISRKMGVPVAKVNGVVSFYSYFTEEPKGDNIISVCMGTACFVRGAQDVLDELELKLGIKAGQTTSDNRYTIDALRCVGACGLAPVVIVNGKVHGKVAKTDVQSILDTIESARTEAEV